MKKSVFLLLLAVSSIQKIESQEAISPDRIMLTIPGNPATSRAVSWRTVYEDTISLGEIALADATPELEQNKITISGTFKPWENDSRQSMGHKVVFENLKPDTRYAYRVGNINNWSEWFQFKTSRKKLNLFHSYILEISRTILSPMVQGF